MTNQHFIWVSGGLNWGLHACTTSILTTERSSHTLAHVCPVSIISNTFNLHLSFQSLIPDPLASLDQLSEYT